MCWGEEILISLNLQNLTCRPDGLCQQFQQEHNSHNSHSCSVPRNKFYQCNQSLYQVHLSISAETIFWAAALALTWVCIKFVPLLLLLASLKDQSTSSVETRRVHPTEIETLSQLFWNCVTRVPLLYFIRSWVALFFKVCESVSQ